MMYQCTKSHCLRSKLYIGRNVSLQILLPEAVCCCLLFCLLFCNCGFDIRVVLRTSVPTLTSKL